MGKRDRCAGNPSTSEKIKLEGNDDDADGNNDTQERNFGLLNGLTHKTFM